MGRPRRRHGRGGAPFTGEPNGLQPGDDVGNRRSFKQTQLPPENIGNRKDPEEEAWVPNDDVGNRIDAAPTHEISGVLAELDGRRRGRRKKGQPHQRVGRYIVGGVNPVVAGNVQRTVEAMKEADERKQQERDLQRASGGGGGPGPSAGGGQPGIGAQNGVDEEGRRGRRRRRRRRDGREQVDGQAAQEVSERRAQRFFDFEEDDRFEYVLKSDPEQKRKDAHEAVASVLSGAGRDALVVSRVLDDENRPKVIVTIDEKGPQQGLSEERRGAGSMEPLFVLGNAALMSLNYLVNKIVNRYPDDRIRLAILPAADEKLYLESLEEHRRSKRSEAPAAVNGAAGKAEPAPSARAAAPVEKRRPVAAARAAEAVPEAAPGETAAAVAEDDVAAGSEQPVEAIAGQVDDERAEAPVEKAKPKRRAAPKVKSAVSKKAAAGEDEGTGATVDTAEDAAAEAAPEDTSGRKATKKKASAKVSSRSRSATDGEKASGSKKAAAKKATVKKTTAKKLPPRKKAPSEG